ncbi:4-hydroxy-3-methylbut-2-en-1-yl diphosphate synthase [Keratinibaculum paraultunense]|uniref:4-hydroxy-3-methylbut-2-en-1-yl diphosphate synthase (flavodoxin) n=1 Tax=Keratinibaculum paraultunense TaxID=1278232 RepID=A0A4V2UU93_9FIRM|nr:flavodoxin-dependent (E)-4-hydroxy-3-methylbut-2-enyl-diphosphate synthase [Keratinibaculum paraultunense]QQY80701.1 flavodoxin-dependent (E)-4-hydroxy-3-methylbut-2-enyl-diphosphate synthase [Keratinibaculum paraultunense]TCS89695.1 4-hydroxy-3-methylbut-2-en-1-yl diphosphate synthase [Keratinibaculum paraultunense]
MKRKKTRKIMVGNVAIGGGSPITVQSMTNTITKDIESTIKQIKDLEKVGCHIVRGAITDLDDAKAINKIKSKINIPFIADIQFDYKLAIASVENGADCLRINPGNIGSEIRVKEVVKACKDRKVPIRIGVNSGSIKKEYLEKYGGVNEDSMVYSALEQIRLLEKLGYENMKISLKASSVLLTIKSYQKISDLVDYPLHLGITEAGPIWRGTIKSSVGIGTLLYMGIGDTIRVSLTGDPIEEVKVGREILRSLGLLEEGIEIISCPTCGRTNIDLVNLVKEAEEKLGYIKKPLKVAIMGCPVNGPGEAKEADIGIAGGKGEGLIFKKGKIIKKVKEEHLIDELLKEIENI